MDPLSALSVIAAVVQFADFGTRLFASTWDIYHDSSGLGKELRSLSEVSQDVSRLSAKIQDAIAESDTDQEMLAYCRKCDELASEIGSMVSQAENKFSKAGTGTTSVGTRFRLAMKQQFGSSKIDNLATQLAGVRNDIVSQATMSTWLGLTYKVSILPLRERTNMCQQDASS